TRSYRSLELSISGTIELWNYRTLELSNSGTPEPSISGSMPIVDSHRHQPDLPNTSLSRSSGGRDTCASDNNRLLVMRQLQEYLVELPPKRLIAPTIGCLQLTRVATSLSRWGQSSAASSTRPVVTRRVRAPVAHLAGHIRQPPFDAPRSVTLQSAPSQPAAPPRTAIRHTADRSIATRRTPSHRGPSHRRPLHCGRLLDSGSPRQMLIARPRRLWRLDAPSGCCEAAEVRQSSLPSGLPLL
ncbi:MAG: hypothetical protein QOH03_765, partial [Kribbellaceae bacterium]|nr:hypothetical protein [Kribbellaceae bacterium]